MGVAIVIAVVIAALLVIAGGTWVAFGLIAALGTPKSEPPGTPDHADLDNAS